MKKVVAKLKWLMFKCGVPPSTAESSVCAQGADRLADIAEAVLTGAEAASL